MKKNILTFVLVIITMISVFYAFTQRTEALVMQKEAERNMELVVTAQNQAQMSALEAMHQQQLASEQRVLLQQQIVNCSKKK